jgi:hypothetical protein
LAQLHHVLCDEHSCVSCWEDNGRQRANPDISCGRVRDVVAVERVRVQIQDPAIEAAADGERVLCAGLALGGSGDGTADVHGARVLAIEELGRVVDRRKHCLHRVRTDRALVHQSSHEARRTIHGWAKSDSASDPTSVRQIISVRIVVQKEFEVVDAGVCGSALETDNIGHIIAFVVRFFVAVLRLDCLIVISSITGGLLEGR